MDLISRGGGPFFYKQFHNLGDPTSGRKRELTEEEKKLVEEGTDPSAPFLKSNLHPGDLLFVSSVSGRTLKVVNLAWGRDAVRCKGHRADKHGLRGSGRTGPRVGQKALRICHADP